MTKAGHYLNSNLEDCGRFTRSVNRSCFCLRQTYDYVVMNVASETRVIDDPPKPLNCRMRLPRSGDGEDVLDLGILPFTSEFSFQAGFDGLVEK